MANVISGSDGLTAKKTEEEYFIEEVKKDMKEGGLTFVDNAQTLYNRDEASSLASFINLTPGNGLAALHQNATEFIDQAETSGINLLLNDPIGTQGKLPPLVKQLREIYRETDNSLNQ